MLLLFLVPYFLPNLINPIFSESPNNISSVTTVYQLHADANYDGKPIFQPASHFDHNTEVHNADNQETKKSEDVVFKDNQEEINHKNTDDNNAQDSENDKVENEHNQKKANVEKIDEPHKSYNTDNEYLNNETKDTKRYNNIHTEHDARVQHIYQNNEDYNYQQNTNSENRNTRLKSKKSNHSKTSKTQNLIPQNDDGVVFIPERNIQTAREDDDYDNIDDIMSGRRSRKLYEIADGKRVEAETEAASAVYFITGKNNEYSENQKEDTPKAEKHTDARRNGVKEETETAAPLDCSHLDCNMTTKAICGVKKEDNKWKYRIFKNECFFRKVNCQFSYDYNRYMIQPLDKCKHIGRDIKRAFNARRRMVAPVDVVQDRTKSQIMINRRSFSSRRSLSRTYNGVLCSHDCPLACPEDYQPECVEDEHKQRRVFLNHCKLDYHSCLHNKVWHKKPLSDCVGATKADVRQNRAFIGWMQRVGIVDGKGKLSFE